MHEGAGRELTGVDICDDGIPVLLQFPPRVPKVPSVTQLATPNPPEPTPNHTKKSRNPRISYFQPPGRRPHSCICISSKTNRTDQQEQCMAPI